MACLNMLNNDHEAGVYTTTMGPRISFSNDIFDTPLRHDINNGYKEAPVSSDFEFSVPGYSMISADELFSKGKLLPLTLSKDNCIKTTKTLKNELQLVDHDHDHIFPRMGKGMMRRWKERFGLKRSHILPHKAHDKSNGVLDRIDGSKTPDFYQYHRRGDN